MAKKIISIIFIILLLVFLLYVGMDQKLNQTVDINPENNISQNITEKEINEDAVVEYENMEEVSENIDFEVSVPEVIENYADREVSVIDDDIVEAKYYSGEKYLILRKFNGDKKDISGIKEKFNNEEQLYVNNIEVSIKGNNGGYNLALWKNNGYSYSVYFSDEVDKTILVSTLISIL